MDRAAWEQALRKAYREVHPAQPRRLSLPRNVDFFGDLNEVTITLPAAATIANLQTDAAAFEAWSLALRVWCGVARVRLCWAIPEKLTNEKGQFTTEGCHYQRFLYRLYHFAEFFPWFSYGTSDGLAGAKALEPAQLLLNVPGKRIDASEYTLGQKPGGKRSAEHELEISLLTTGDLKNEFHLDKCGRQFPVGLFIGEVAAGNRVFTGGKSAIDLIGIRGRTLVLFELKAHGNIPAGILSELIFYACVMRDALPRGAGMSARFQFANRKSGTAAEEITAEDVLKCNAIEAVLLARELHPIFTGGAILKQLNDASTARLAGSNIPVTFSCASLQTWH